MTACLQFTQSSFQTWMERAVTVGTRLKENLPLCPSDPAPGLGRAWCPPNRQERRGHPRGAEERNSPEHLVGASLRIRPCVILSPVAPQGNASQGCVPCTVLPLVRWHGVGCEPKPTESFSNLLLWLPPLLSKGSLSELFTQNHSSWKSVDYS